MLSSSKAMRELTEEQQNLQKELESLQSEHAQRMEEFYVEQKDLEKKLEQVMKQKCTCDSNLEKDKEAEYAAQVRITQFVYVPFQCGNGNYYCCVKAHSLGEISRQIILLNSILYYFVEDDFLAFIALNFYRVPVIQ